MLELISIGVSCLVLVIVPDSRKYNDKVYDQKLGYPYQYFKGEVLSDEEVRYRCRLMYLYLMFSLSVSQAVVPYASSVMLPPPTGVTSIELVTSRNDYNDLMSKLRGGGTDPKELVVQIMILHHLMNRGISFRPPIRQVPQVG